MLLSRQRSSAVGTCPRHDRTIYRSGFTTRQLPHHRAQQYRHKADAVTSGSHRSWTICRSAGAKVAAAATPTILYVSQLDSSIKGDELTAHFKDQPGFDSAFMMSVTGEDGQQQNMGYVQFSSPQAAAAAQKALDGSELREKRIRVRAQSGSNQDDVEPEQSTDLAEPDAPSTPQHTAATTVSSEASGNATNAEDGSAEGASESEVEGTAGMSRSKKHRLRQKAKNPGPPAPSTKVLFVPNMKQGTTEEQLTEHFREQPGYESAQLRIFQRRRYDGYVTFDTAEAATAAMEALQGLVLNDKPLKIHVHEFLTKERSAALAAANAAKSQKQPQKQQEQQQQEEGSEDKPKRQTTPRRQQGSRQTFSVKVINLAWSTTAEGLTQHFADCPGFVDAVTIPEDDGRASGIGYVKFKTADTAQAAIKAKHESELDGRSINVFISSKEAGKFAAAEEAAAAASGNSKGRGKRAWALQVFNMAWETTDADLVEHFKDCPGYTGAFIVTSKDNRPSGQGYVTFDSNEAQLAAFKAKQNSELVGRGIDVHLTRTGRVESTQAEGDSAAAGQATGGTVEDTVAALEKTAIVLMGLPPSFTYREVLGLCSYFGRVKSVVRMRKGLKAATSDSSSGSAAEGSAAAAGQDTARDEADMARMGQPSFVLFESARSAAAAVSALNGRTVQGCKVAAAFATPKKAPNKRKAKSAEKTQSTQDDSKAELSSP